MLPPLPRLRRGRHVLQAFDTSSGEIDEAQLAQQEEFFSAAFAAGKIELARTHYHPAVVYQSPTVRLFAWTSPIDGIERTLEFIQLTIARCDDLRYEAVEQACRPDGHSAFVRIHFDWGTEKVRLRSNYVVIYRFRDRLIVGQELYYDPSGQLERLS